MPSRKQQGAERAAYPLKLLQSEGQLKIASTGKDPVSGKQVTHEYTVEGPVMIFLTTTAQEVDEELLNRCHRAHGERGAGTDAGDPSKAARGADHRGTVGAGRDRAEIVKLASQRAAALAARSRWSTSTSEEQTFPTTMTRTRRDHKKFLTLIAGDCVAPSAPAGDQDEHARRRNAGIHRGHGSRRKAGAGELVHRGADAIARRAAAADAALAVADRHDGDRRNASACRSNVPSTVSRGATVRQYTRWGDTQLRVHLRRLEELEYLIVRHGAPGQTFVYQLNFEMDAEGRPVLARLSQFYSYDTNCAGVNGHYAGGARPASGGVAGGARGEESPVLARRNGDFSSNHENNSIRGMDAGSEGGNCIVALPPVPVKPNGRLAAGVK